VLVRRARDFRAEERVPEPHLDLPEAEILVRGRKEEDEGFDADFDLDAPAPAVAKKEPDADFNLGQASFGSQPAAPQLRFAPQWSVLRYASDSLPFPVSYCFAPTTQHHEPWTIALKF
jgi:hypothetical protein